ncbi:hypothetical protein WJX81_000507 [Elliptochloris bilobata]|uniref:Uncharacterized protein n=1 Tax=Elliptochloris bilobata TaxID=381761 RepID=A0AAW1S078_9CHLO
MRLQVPSTVHFALLAWHLFVWTWHFLSPLAKNLPGAVGFGWFFRYLTFFSYTLQLVQLIVCCVAVVLPASKLREAVTHFADDLSCSVFGLANAVTIMFHVLQWTTRDVVEGGDVERPFWLGASVHIFNAVTAWLDLLLGAPRSFSARARQMSTAFTLVYTQWILVCRVANNEFPYPFMNKLPFPQGFFFVSTSATLLLYGFFMDEQR